MCPAFQLAENMKDAPVTLSTPKGGNRPLWFMGHLGYAEARGEVDAG